MGRGRDLGRLGGGGLPKIKDEYGKAEADLWRTISRVRSLSSRGDGELKIKEKPSALRHPRDSDARAREETRSLTGSMISLGHDALSLDATTREEKLEFFRRLARLRPHAETFHDMMNMSIKRFQEVDDDREPRAETYKVVINDLSRVLLLLTKKSSIMMPADGNKLLLWAERVLQRFRQQKLDNNECNIHTMGSDQGESSDDHSDQSERGLLKGGRSRQPIKRCQSQSLQHAATRIHSKLLEKFGSTPNLKLPIGMPIAEESQSGGSSAGSSPPPPLHQSQTRRGRVVTLL
ncbi:PREDICTED: uncharacterized protein LOC106821075 [Priapulus caudatus]|uniref:Uncharacterized protein LOC106821075 n=1 Tax=Priapulus caudatus TaxID=37621 RepID=A0ABM1F9T4_PRICU|nr:PREDICTED: uncharacterized protein LOC106821075 [Priapulus caudatus]